MATTPDVIAQHIVQTPTVAGGKPRVAGRRITVQQIAIWHERLGLTADAIADAYDLTLGDVHAALAYYHDHRAEIDATIRDDEAFVAELRQRTASRLAARLGG
jgi:uncharacterized protein (DUF433 family)